MNTLCAFCGAGAGLDAALISAGRDQERPEEPLDFNVGGALRRADGGLGIWTVPNGIKIGTTERASHIKIVQRHPQHRA